MAPWEIEFLGRPLFFGLSALGALLSLTLWLYVGIRVRPLTPTLLHKITIRLTASAFVMLDLTLLWWFVWRPGGELFRLVIAFDFGVQTTAAIAAVAFVRDVRRKRGLR